ncbi:succinate dehydrogenase assembly factor 4 [Roseomonas sp. BN140053]|uniref:succinate dehydrogenase assembly factor 4 n=1 Tax=Roseomonas sp. BN140053 TaxID=3391898 RepID=UPI0039E76F39
MTEKTSSPPAPTATPVPENQAPPDAASRSANPPLPKPVPGEVGGPSGPEPTRYGDWERKGRVSDF